MPSILVCGIVSQRDLRPYIQVDVDGRVMQMSMAEARSVARDIELQCSRAEADAMLVKFFRESKFPQGAAEQLLIDFREFRSKIDAEEVERFEKDPGK